MPRTDTGFLAQPRFGETSLSAVSGVWSVVTALAVASLALVVLLRKRLLQLRKTLDAGADASALPVLNTASLVGFGAVVAALPVFAVVRDGILAVPGGPLVSIAVAANVLGGMTGSASGGLTIALNALGETYAQLASAAGIHRELMIAWRPSAPARLPCCRTMAPSLPCWRSAALPSVEATAKS